MQRSPTGAPARVPLHQCATPTTTRCTVVGMMGIILRRSFAIALAAALLCTSSAAFAGRHRSFGGGGFASNGTFGLGIELGEPSGLNGKYFYQPDKAIDFGLGWVYHHYYGGDGFHLYVDHLWH